MEAPVVFDGVWKKFRQGERHDSLRDLIPSTLRRLGGRTRKTETLATEEFWALEDVSFEVQQGRALGIIGPNGAGKSTTLKLLTKILRPNRGFCQVKGRVGALIEVAAGFHPDLTGRENVYLQGAIMGMRRAEVAARFDEIVAFAGVERFMDTPVKRYSSGMNARLGFSIAAHLRPDVLIIDEVLSVGDMAYQERCLERMKKFKSEGVAIVFVSHNLQAISELCDNAIYLNHEVRAIGTIDRVLDRYIGEVVVPSGEATGDGMSILSAKLSQGSGEVIPGAVAPRTALRLSAVYETSHRRDDLTFGLVIRRSTDQLLVYEGGFPGSELHPLPMQLAKFELQFDFFCHLTRGQYHLELHVFHNSRHLFLARMRPAAHFTVAEGRTWNGVVDLDAHVTVASNSRREASALTEV